MKKPALLIVLMCLADLGTSQSIYKEKWKDGVYFKVPITFEKEQINDEKVVFRHEKGEAQLQITKWPLEKIASSQEELDASILEVARKLNYSNPNILSQEILNEHDPSPDFRGCRATFIQDGKQVILSALLSTRSNMNYVILVEATEEYASKYKIQLKRLSQGLQEY